MAGCAGQQDRAETSTIRTETATATERPTATEWDDPPRPNVVIFLADDMGWPQLADDYPVDTPTIDGMAADGASFENFYVQPVCSPTRSCCLTGRYPWRTGTVERPHRPTTNGMWPDERTMGELLGDAGYDTWLTGKWHLGQWKTEHLPQNRGFDHAYGNYSALINQFNHMRGLTKEEREEEFPDHPLDGILDWHRNGEPVVEEGYSTTLIADEAVSLIEDHDGEDPFFLFVPFTAVHSPYQAPDEYIRPYVDHGHPDATIMGMLDAMDDAMGRIMDAVSANGYAENTLSMFINDNGPSPAHPKGPDRGMKGQFYEGGVRVPAYATWPGRIEAGSTVEAMVHINDLYPTVGNLAGADLDQEKPIDGADIWRTITGDAGSPHEELLFDPNVIRRGRWKFVAEGTTRYKMEGGPAKLYDLEADPMEENNVATDNPEVVSELQDRLAEVREQTRMWQNLESIPNYPPIVYGEEENAEYGDQLLEQLTSS
jgi:arylsulfatase A-like enzyme